MSNIKSIGKIRQNDKILALKIKTESNGLGALKTIVILLLIAVQLALMIVSYLYFLTIFKGYFIFSILCSFIACLHALSSDYNGQAKAMWVLFLITSFSFGYIIYIMSDKRVLFGKSRKKMAKIEKEVSSVIKVKDVSFVENDNVKAIANYLSKVGGFDYYTDSKTTYFSSGTLFFDDVILELKKAKKFIFLEFYIVSDGVLLKRILDILKEKVKNGVDVRIIYDDVGSHRTLKRKTKREIVKAGIKLQAFNRLVPIFNIALNLRDHRKIVIIDGSVSYTGGANLADEYINEKRMHGYWKDSAIKIEGNAVNNLTIAFLKQWQFLTTQSVDYRKFVENKDAKNFNQGIVIPFVSGPNYDSSIAQNMYINLISSANKKLYIMTPYFIPDETIYNLLINKARQGVDVRIILPDVADKKFVYIVSRNNAEKLLKYGVRLYTMTSSFVHSKVVLSENLAIVGSINMDLRSFNQQFESAVITSDMATILDAQKDFTATFTRSNEITWLNAKRNKLGYRVLAGLFNLISPFM